MKTNLFRIIAIIINILFFGTWINGCVHSFRKHKDDPIWFQLSPLVMYRGAEFFWHDDFAGVDWNVRIENDAATLCELFNLSTQTTNIDNTRMELESFSKKIQAYPKDKFEDLKTVGQMYVRYNIALIDDLSTYTSELLEGIDNSPKDWSKRSKMIGDSLHRKYKITYPMNEQESLDSSVIDLRLKAGFGEMEEVKIFHDAILSKGKEFISLIKSSYFTIFREKYD